MKTLNLNITQKFIGYLIALSIIPLLTVGGVSFQAASDTVRGITAQYTKQLIINQRDYLDLQLVQIESLISNIVGVEAIREVLEDETLITDTYTYLTTQANIGYTLNAYTSLDGLVSIDIFSVGGNQYHVGDTLNTDDIRIDIKDEIFAEALKTDQPVSWIGIVDNVNANSAHKQVITAAKVIYKFDRETLAQVPIALVLVNYSVDVLYDHLIEVDLGENAYLIVVDSYDRLIYHPDRTKIGEQINPSLRATVSTDTDINEIVLDDIALSINLIQSNISDWTIISLIPIETLLSKTELIQRTTIIVLMISFIAVGIIGWIYNRSVVTPIRHITNRFKRVRHESSTIQSRIPERGNDEITELNRWFNTFMDVLQARQEADRQRVELTIERERRELLTNFITDASHEFRTPLTVIATSMYLIEKTTDSEKRHSRIKTVEDQIEHLTTLVDSLIYMTKLDSGDTEFTHKQVDLNKLAQSIYKLEQSKSQDDKPDYSLDLCEYPLNTQGDPEYLKDAIQRVWDNAIQYTAKGETVVLQTSKSDSHATITIINTGKSIREEDMPHIFKRFYRSDKAGSTRGFGLGLPIAKTIIELHKGTITVDNKPNVNCIFTIKLPL